MKRPICAIAIIYILVIIGLHFLGVVFLDYDKVYEEMSKYSEKRIKAIVIDEKEEKEYKYVYIIKILDNNKLINGKKYILNIKKGNEKISKLEYGDIIEFKGEYTKPSSKRNYGGYDYSLYLKTQNIYGSIETSSFKILEKDRGNKIYGAIYKFKVAVKNKLRKYLKEEQAELCIGLVIGDRTGLSEEVQEDFKNANLTHMLAVSGSHFTYIILAVTYLNNGIKRKRLGNIITIIVIILFMNLTGNTASVVRSGIMAIITVLSSFVYKKSDIWTSMAIAIIIQLVQNPYIIFDIGLILSYGGVIGIVLFYRDVLNYINKKIEKILKIKEIEKNEDNKAKLIKYINEGISVTVSANIIIIPIMVFNFNTLSCTFIISNLLAGPLLGIIVIFAFLIIFASFILQELIIPFFYILEIMLKILMKIAEISGNMPLSKIYLPTPNIYLLLLLYLNIILIKYLREKSKKIKKYLVISVIIILCLNYIYPIINSKKKNIEINFIDVGQGDSTLIRIENKSILVDGGGSMYTNSFDVGEKTLFPYLLDRGIMSLDYLIVSHFDADHSQGLRYVLKNMKVKNIVISKLGQESKEYDEFMKLSIKQKSKIYYVKKGDLLKIGKGIIEIIYPDNEIINENVKNNNAMVFKLTYDNISMLFTGDIEEIAEKKILNIYKDNKEKLEADILKVAHHGSKTSSIKNFLETVNPKIALIGVGEDNNFGHPNSGVIQRLEDINVKIYRTDKCGEIIITIDKKNEDNINIHTMINNKTK